VAVRIPSNAAITRSRVGVVPIVLAAFVLNGMVHLARGVVPVSFAEVSRSAIALVSVLPFVTAGPDLLVLLDGTVITDARGIFILHVKLGVAKSIDIALGSGAAVALLFTLIVPRDAALMIGEGVGHACEIVHHFLFAVITRVAFGVPHIEFWNVVRGIFGVIVVASLPRVAVGMIVCVWVCMKRNKTID
jgi:hypothetical protein